MRIGLLAALLGAMVVVAMMLWRMNSKARDAKGGFKSRPRQATGQFEYLAKVTDPREAAACMLVAVAQADGAMTERARASIARNMVEVFVASGEEANTLLAHARKVVYRQNDCAPVLRTLAPVILARLEIKERAELIRMLSEVAAANGKPRPSEVFAIAELRQSLGVQKLLED